MEIGQNWKMEKKKKYVHKEKKKDKEKEMYNRKWFE